MPKKFTHKQKHGIWQKLKHGISVSVVAEEFQVDEKVIQSQFTKKLKLTKVYWSRAAKYPHAKYTWNDSSQKWLMNYAGVYITRCVEEDEAARLEDLIVATIFPERRKTHDWNIDMPSKADMKKFKTEYKEKIKEMKKKDKSYDWYTARLKNNPRETVFSEYNKGEQIPKNPTRIVSTLKKKENVSSSPESDPSGCSGSSESESDSEESESDSEENGSDSEPESSPHGASRRKHTHSRRNSWIDLQTFTGNWESLISWENLPSGVKSSSTSADSLSSTVPQRSSSPVAGRTSRSMNSTDEIIRAIGAETFASSASHTVPSSAERAPDPPTLNRSMVLQRSRREQARDMLILIQKQQQQAKARSNPAHQPSRKRNRSQPPPPRKRKKKVTKKKVKQPHQTLTIVDLTIEEKSPKDTRKFWCTNFDILEGSTVVWFDKRIHQNFCEFDQMPFLEIVEE